MLSSRTNKIYSQNFFSNNLKRLDSTNSYTSGEDETPANQSHSFISQTSHESVISYYNPASTDDEEPQSTSSHYLNETVKRSYSFTSDEADTVSSTKRQKFSESYSDSPYPSDAENPSSFEANNGKSNTFEKHVYSDKAAKMMEKMGYKKQTGLGRQGQGIIHVSHEIIQACFDLKSTLLF